MRKNLAGFPWLVMLLLVIFVDGLYGGLYRLTGKKLFSKIVGILQLVAFAGSICSFAIALPGILGWICRVIYIVCWVCDIITVLFSKKITLFAD